jgi:hypothetical protein
VSSELTASALVVVIFVGGMFVLGVRVRVRRQWCCWERRGNMAADGRLSYIPSILSITLGSRNENRRLVLSSASLYEVIRFQQIPYTVLAFLMFMPNGERLSALCRRREPRGGFLYLRRTSCMVVLSLCKSQNAGLLVQNVPI